MQLSLGKYKTRGGWEAEVYAHYSNVKVSNDGKGKAGFLAVHKTPTGAMAAWHYDDGTPQYFSESFSLVELI